MKVSTLKMGLLVSLLVSLGLGVAQAAPKQRTIWVDRDNYLADPSANADCEDQMNTDDNNQPAKNDALSILKDVATKALVPPNAIDGCMQNKGYIKKVITGSKLPPTRPTGYQAPQQGYPQQQPVYQQPPQSYPQQQPIYQQPPQQGYPQQAPVYQQPPQQGYPQQAPVYQQQQQGYPQQAPVYPPQY